MYKKVFLEHWIDWTIAIIIMAFIMVWGAVQQFSIEQDDNLTGNNIYYSDKLQNKSSQTNYELITFQDDGKPFQLSIPTGLTKQLSSSGISSSGKRTLFNHINTSKIDLSYMIYVSTVNDAGLTLEENIMRFFIQDEQELNKLLASQDDKNNLRKFNIFNDDAYVRTELPESIYAYIGDKENSRIVLISIDIGNYYDFSYGSGELKIKIESQLTSMFDKVIKSFRLVKR